MNRLLLLFVGMTVLMAVIIGVGRNFFQKKSQQAYNGPVEKIAVGNVREYSIFNVIAKDEGYFAANGLDADVREYESGPAAVHDLLAGKVDVAFASDNAGVQTIFTHPELKIISQFVRNRVFSVIARRDRGITTPSDLRGKKIGVTKKSAGEFLLGQFLTLKQLRQQDVILVDLPPSQIETQLKQGTIDAGVLFEPSVFNVTTNLGAKAVEWPIEDGYYTFGLIYTTDAYVKKHPILLQRFLQSLVEAEQYVADHPTETKELIAKRFGYSKEYIDYSWPKNNHSLGLDQDLLLSMENIAEWSIENKLTNKTTVPNYLDYIYFNALEKVKPESINIIH